jgi:hypothetical protein
VTQTTTAVKTRKTFSLTESLSAKMLTLTNAFEETTFGLNIWHLAFLQRMGDYLYAFPFCFLP